MMRQMRNWAGYAALMLMMVLVVLPIRGEAAEQLKEVIIFHTNDMHARVLPEDDFGQSIGLSHLAAAVKAVKQENPRTLWLDAGDTLHGMPRINISKGENMVHLLNQSGMDILVPGNHDFNYGSAQLEVLAKELKFPVLSANTVRKGSRKHPFLSYMIFKLDGVKIGVFGLTTPETAYKTNPNNVKTIAFQDPIVVAQEMVKKLRPKCDILVAVMHMGVDESSEFTSERIAKAAQGIDLIVDGHSHTALPEGMMVGNTLIVQTGWHEYRLGKVELTVKNHQVAKKEASLLTADEVARLAAKPDMAVEKTLKDMEARNEKLFNEVLTHTERALSSDRLLVRRHEAEIGNLCADAFRWSTGADIGIVNGGSLRSDLPAGDVTRGDVMAIFPFGNTVQKAEIDGKTIHAMLEHAVYGYPASFGGFLDVSGMTFGFDPTQPIGKRVTDIKINGRPLDESHTYTIATNDFLFAGGDDYEMLKGLSIVGEYATCEEILTDYLNNVGMKGIEPGRIRVLKEVPIPEEVPDGAVPEEYREAA